jgi:hypothetical protein
MPSVQKHRQVSRGIVQTRRGNGNLTIACYDVGKKRRKPMRLEAHLMHRETLHCPLIARAWAGGEAAHRLEDVTAAKNEALPHYQEMLRIWERAGDNLRAAIEREYLAGVALMAATWRDFERARAAELTTIDLERAA